MDKLKNRISAMFMVVIMSAMMLVSPFMSMTSYALSARVAFSDPSVMTGNEVTVNMKISSLSGDALGSAQVMLTYDPNYLEFVSGTNAEGGAGSIRVSGGTEDGATTWAYALKFKALQPGETAISVADWEIYDGNSQMATLDKQGSSKVTITAEASSSTVADLTALKISPGSLSPEFSADVTDYTAIVGGDVDKIAVSAPTADANAKVVISGNSDLQIGTNTISCKVTAEDGKTVKTYNIVVTKEEGAVTPTETVEGAELSNHKVNIAGTEYDIATTFDASLLPEGYEASQFTYKDGNTYQAGKGIDKDITIMYLITSDGSGDFFTYDETSDTWSPLVEINVSAKSITVVPLPSGVTLPVGFAETILELNGKKVTGWVWESDTEKRYCVFYGMNSDGEKNFYRYDFTEKTLQRYFEDPAIDSGVSTEDYVNAATQYNSLLKDYNTRGIILFILAALSIILGAALAASLVIGKRKKKDVEAEEEDEDFEEVKVAKAKPLTKEEKYLRGEEDEVEEPQKPEEIIEEESKKVEAEITKKLAQKIDKKDTDSDSDDDFESFDL